MQNWWTGIDDSASRGSMVGAQSLTKRPKFRSSSVTSASSIEQKLPDPFRLVLRMAHPPMTTRRPMWLFWYDPSSASQRGCQALENCVVYPLLLRVCQHVLASHSRERRTTRCERTVAVCTPHFSTMARAVSVIPLPTCTLC